MFVQTRDFELGKVFNQIPKPGETVPGGSTITVEIAVAPILPPVPSLVGLTEEAARQEAWDGRERYGDHGSMLGSGGLGGHLLVAVPESARGGGLVSLQGRFGYDIESVSGLELRAGLDIFLGSASGFALTGGAAYLASPFQDTPIFVGGAVELGYYQALSGNRVPSLLVRASALGTWRMSDDLYLEVALPELTALSANGGALSIGTSVRVGSRF